MQSVILLHSTTTTYHPSPQNLSALYSAVVWLLESGKTGGESRYCFPVGSFSLQMYYYIGDSFSSPVNDGALFLKYLFPPAVKVEYTILTWREKFRAAFVCCQNCNPTYNSNVHFSSGKVAESNCSYYVGINTNAHFLTLFYEKLLWNICHSSMLRNGMGVPCEWPQAICLCI